MSANKQKHPFHLGATRQPGGGAHVEPGQAPLHVKGERSEQSTTFGSAQTECAAGVTLVV
jgi:hypothetical protein